MKDTISKDTKLIRTIHPEVRVVDAEKGIVDYVASDESLDSYREVIRADGWRFDRFAKNAPFVDSHDYWTISKLLGAVIGWEIRGRQLVERVQWAIDVPENDLARLGWQMTVKGYLRAVSVGFFPVSWLSKYSGENEAFAEQLQDLGMGDTDNVQRIFLEQQQIELSSCIIGANGNALAKAMEDGAVSEREVAPLIKSLFGKRDPADSAAPGATAATESDPSPDAVARTRMRQRLAILFNL